METPILQYDSGVIAAKLDRTEKELVHKVSFHISCGESLTLIGETGSGKTVYYGGVAWKCETGLR